MSLSTPTSLESELPFRCSCAEPHDRGVVRCGASCPRCVTGRLRDLERLELFHPPTGVEVAVLQLSTCCDACGWQTVAASQVTENLRRLLDRRQQYGEFLLGEDIRAFRCRCGMSRAAFASVFGRCAADFLEYETEKTYPDLSLTRLLRVAMRHSWVFEELADAAGVALAPCA